MPTKLPEDVKQRAKAKCACCPNLEVEDPGSMFIAEDERLLVMVRDKVTGLQLWVEVQPFEANPFPW
jgi:hypothetical protein